MSYHLYQRKVYLKRMPLYVDRTQGIQTFGADNLYPQRMEEIKNDSKDTKNAVARLGSFIYGDGWEDLVLANLVMNAKGHKANKILRLLSPDRASFDGFALHFKYNLNFKIAEVSVLEFMYNRFGIADEEDDVHDIKYCTNWERDPYKSTQRAIKIFDYPVFNPDPNVVREQMMQHGWDNYPGQILFWTPKEGKYPYATFDPVANDAQTQAEISLFDVAAMQNGLTAATIFKYPGTFATKAEETEFKNDIQQYKGSTNAKSIIVIENPQGSEADLVESLQLQNTDKMHEGIDKRTKNAIRENFSQPMEILGHSPDAGMFNKQQILEAYEFYNTITDPYRVDTSEVFETIVKHWWQPLPIINFNIKPKAYVKTVVTTAVNNGQTANNPTGTGQVPANR